MKKMLMIAMLLSAPFVSQAGILDYFTGSSSKPKTTNTRPKSTPVGSRSSEGFQILVTESSLRRDINKQANAHLINYGSTWLGLITDAKRKFGSNSDKFQLVLEKIDEFLSDTPMSDKEELKALDNIHHWYIKTPKA